MFPVKIEAIGLVTGLHGTGSDPEPSPQRAMLMAELQRRGVDEPNRLLASRNVSLVVVRGVLRPGIQKGDHFDVELRIPARSETTSLRGGFLLETRLSDMAVLNDRVFDGKPRGIAQGPLLVDPSATEKSDKVLLGRGVVLGGGLAQQPRSLGLFLNGAEETNMTPEQIRDAAVKSAQVANAINRRFHSFKHGIKAGVARAVRGNYVDLMVYKPYKDNLDRYFQVLRSIELRETPAQLNQRIVDMEKKLLEPSTAADACIQLEGIGKSGVEALVKASQSSNAEVRFYAAESLAYLDAREAAQPLAAAARDVPAFRSRALTAMSVMTDSTAFDQLRELLGVESAETRYGAFRALTINSADDVMVKGEMLGEQFSYHVLDTKGPAMIHVTRNRRAEVVLFGQEQRFLTPIAVNAGNQIMVTSGNGKEISVSKFTPHQADQKRVVSTRIDDVIRAIVELGGTYPDVVQCIEEAKTSGCLEGRFEVDALPEEGRSYDAKGDDASKTNGEKADEAKDAKKDEKTVKAE